MVAFRQGFSAREVQPMGSGSQMPISDEKGWNVVIIGSSVEPTQADPNNGKLVLTMVIVDGEAQGVEGNDNLNIFHSNPTTSAMADQQLSAYCWAVRKPDAKMTEELHNIPFKIVVTKNPKDDRYVNIKPLAADGSKPSDLAKGVNSGPGQQAPPTAPPQAPPPQQQQAPPPQQQQTPPPAGQQWGGQPPANEAPPAAPPWGGGGQPATAPPWASR
jgi:hypothetical protein